MRWGHVVQFILPFYTREVILVIPLNAIPIIFWCGGQIDVSIHLITRVTVWNPFHDPGSMTINNNTKCRFHLWKIISRCHINSRCFRFEPEQYLKNDYSSSRSGNSRDLVRDGPVIEGSWSGGVSVDSRKFIFNKLADRSDFVLDSRYGVTWWNASESTDRG